MILILSWKSSFLVWSTKFFKIFYLSFLLCMELIRKGVITCWLWCWIPSIKSICVVITYLGHENLTTLVINYDEQLLTLLLLEVNYKVKWCLLRLIMFYEFASFVDFQDYFNKLTQMKTTTRTLWVNNLVDFIIILLLHKFANVF
jgi:hypothetical protein